MLFTDKIEEQALNVIKKDEIPLDLQTRHELG